MKKPDGRPPHSLAKIESLQTRPKRSLEIPTLLESALLWHLCEKNKKTGISLEPIFLE